MADRKISDLTALTTPATGDLLPIVDVSEVAAADKNKKITVQELFKGVPDGTAAAPGLAFESDDGNGIYLAGTDTVGIATGGAQRVTVNASGDVAISGNLTVSGTTTTIDSTTLTVDDKNIELGSVASPSDTTADGGGVTLKGASDKTLTWVQSTGMWTSNQPFDVAGELQCDSLDVDGAADITGNVTLHANLDLQDNDKILLGTGDDLEIYHSGGHSIIADVGTGQLRLWSNAFRVQNAAGTETQITANENSSVTLAFDGNVKLTTASGGIDVTGEVKGDSLNIDGAADITGNVTLHADLDMQDSDRIMLGTGDDLQIQHDGATSSINNFTGNLFLQNYADNQDIELRTDDSSGGVTTYLLCDGSNGQVNLYHYGSGKLNTTSGGINVTGSVTCDGLVCDGDANIRAGTGVLTIQDNDSTGNATNVFLRGRNSSNSTRWQVGQTSTGNENLYVQNFAGAPIVFATNGANRVIIQGDGHLVPNDDDSYDIGSSSAQWRNAYFDGTVNCDGLTCDSFATINTSSGQLILKDTNSSGAGAQVTIEGRDSTNAAKWTFGQTTTSNENLRAWNYANASFEVATNNALRFRVQNDGHVVPNDDNTYDLGTSSLEWRNAYFDGTVNCDGLSVDGAANLQHKVYSTENTATASAFNLANGNFWTFGAIAVPNPTSQTAGMMGSLRVTAAPVSFAGNWKFPGGSYTAPTSFPAIAPFYVQASGTILVGSWTEGIA